MMADAAKTGGPKIKVRHYLMAIFFWLGGVSGVAPFEVANRRYARATRPFDVAHTVDKESIVAVLQMMMEANDRRRDEINGKLRLVLQLTTVMIGASIAIGQKVSPAWLVLFPLALSGMTILALAHYLEVSRTASIGLDRDYAEAESKDDVSLAMIKDLQTVIIDNSSVTDFLVDAYRVSRSFFLYSFLLFMAIAIYWTIGAGAPHSCP